jgi:alpha-beta hydrolase superfamily lysophospholipase
MRTIFLTALFAAVITPVVSAGAAPSSLHFTAADGVTVFALSYAHAGRARGTILLFHQAGSNKSEYDFIAPRLAKAGFDAVAVDQRAGGNLFGKPNQTVNKLGGETGYEAALPDLEAALAHAKVTAPGQKVLVWGSSYSASLVFVLAAKHPEEISAVLSFSPGEYFGATSVSGAAAKVTAPVYITSASDTGEVAEAKAIANAVPAGLATQFVPRHGVHGASTLRKDQNPKGLVENWAALEAFLAKAAP